MKWLVSWKENRDTTSLVKEQGAITVEDRGFVSVVLAPSPKDLRFWQENRKRRRGERHRGGSRATQSLPQEAHRGAFVWGRSCLTGPDRGRGGRPLETRSKRHRW